MGVTEILLPAQDYDLSATLSSGQAFRWRERAGAWEGVIGRSWVQLRLTSKGICARTACPQEDWKWLEDYLQTHVVLGDILATFPDDEPMRKAIGACRGLRLLRQEMWECLASFILSSTKQIAQIRQIVENLCARFGEPVSVPEDHPAVCSFPTAARLARCAESELRACKMGFRAPNLLRTARLVAEGEVRLEALSGLTLEQARLELLRLPGVGRKIADCVLLFAAGFPTAFPVDVWIERALRQLYFPRQRPSSRRLLEFAATHFGPNGGYAQQYLFHQARQRRGRPK